MKSDRLGELIYIGLFLSPILLLVIAVIAAHRFARRREREGRWNSDGPVDPSPPPGDWGLVPGYGAHRPQIESEPDGDPPDDAA
jgi:hypothetical protein